MDRHAAFYVYSHLMTHETDAQFVWHLAPSGSQNHINKVASWFSLSLFPPVADLLWEQSSQLFKNLLCRC